MKFIEALLSKILIKKDMDNFWKVLLLLIAAIAAGFNLSIAADYKVSGELVDSISGEGEPFVTYRIYSTASSDSVIVTSVTNEKGLFTETLPEEGDYKIIFTIVGRREEVRSFAVSPDKPEYNLGKILLIDDVADLDEVTVTVRKPLLEADMDKVAYNVAEDPSSQTMTVLDMLRKVPKVIVDGQDNITVNGSSSFKVYVNGRPDQMMSSNPSEMLKTMPASSVKKIEVITEPGAKYDAEGVGGIINLITETGRNLTDGYVATLSGYVDNQSYNGSLQGRIKAGKFVVGAYYSHNGMYGYDQSMDVVREDFTSEAMRYLSSRQTSTQDYDSDYANVQASFEPDTLNLFTMSFNLRNWKMTQDGYKHTWMQNVQRDDIWQYDASNIYKMSAFSVSAQADYQHTFGKPMHNLILSYKYSHGNSETDSYLYYLNPVDIPYSLVNQRNYTSAPTNEHTIQVDYTNPLSDAHTIETGAKMIIRRNSSLAEYYMEKDKAFEELPLNAVELEQYQDVYALYAAYTLKYKRLGAKAGLRYEHTRMGVDFRTSGYENYSSRLNNFVPNAMLSWKISDASNVRLTYQMRINRPYVGSLNPYRDTSNPTSVSYGNPRLQSETANSVGLAYSSFGNIFSWDVSLKYTLCNDGIADYSFIDNGITYHTSGNIVNSRVFSSWGYVMANITSAMQLSVNFGLTYRDFRSSALNQKASGWGGSLYANYNYSMPWKLRLNVYGGFGRMGQLNLQTYAGTWSTYGLSLSRSFLKDNRLTITIDAQDLFRDKRKFKAQSITPDYRTMNNTSQSSWTCGISVRYTFGGLKTDVKKVAKSIVNDDVQQSSSGGSSSPGN